MEWHSVDFSEESRFCLSATDGHTRVRHGLGERRLPESIRPRHIDPTPDFMVCGAISYNSRSHLVFLQVKVNRASYIAQVMKFVLLPFFFERNVMCFSAGQRTSTHGS